MRMRITEKIFVLTLTVTLLIACILPVSADEIKKLYFEESNGTMTWNPVRGSDGNWFMSFTNMIPGCKYQDILQIENGSKKTYRLYVQAVPNQQDEKKNMLLELISMKVVLDDNILYEGTASGKEYENGNLQDVIYLGTYKSSGKSHISVQLELDKDVGLEYCDTLTKLDWKFMVTEIHDPEKKAEVIQPPQTGDKYNIAPFAILTILSSVLLFNLIKHKKKTSIQ